MMITRRLEIDSGHRLINHPGKCKNYHGHRYLFELTFTAPTMIDGMVIDFGVIKEKVGEWLNMNWDHGMILQNGDPMISMLLKTDSKVYILDNPPTAEELCKELWHVIEMHRYGYWFFPKELELVKIDCWETPNCKATYTGPPITVPA